MRSCIEKTQSHCFRFTKMGKKGEKHVSLKLHQKQELIKYATDNPNYTQDDYVKWVDKQFKVTLSRTTVSKILSKKNDITNQTVAIDEDETPQQREQPSLNNNIDI